MFNEIVSSKANYLNTLKKLNEKNENDTNKRYSAQVNQTHPKVLKLQKIALKMKKWSEIRRVLNFFVLRKKKKF